MIANLTPATVTALPLDGWLHLLEQRHPTEIDLGLDRVGEVAARLSLTSPARQTIVVAGTNGKGSCVAVMDHLLRQMGKTVGCYTSPHLLRYNERITVCGVAVTDAQLCAAFSRIERARGHISLTYFEFATLAALCVMAAADLDVALLEVGLGGRLDAVNIIDGDAAIVTSIDLDHQQWLGNTRTAIGLEKVAVARPGRPLICGDADPPQALCDYLADWDESAYYLGQNGFSLNSENHTLALHCRTPQGESVDYPMLPATQIPLPSIACAVQALIALGHRPAEAQLSSALADVRIPGRMQWLTTTGSGVVLDVAHNPAATTLLARQLTSLKRGRVVALFAVMADKDFAAMMASLASLVDHWVLCGLPDVTRAASPAQLVAAGNALRLDTECHADVRTGYTAALNDMGGEDILVVFGSFYTVSAVLQLHREQEGAGE